MGLSVGGSWEASRDVISCNSCSCSWDRPGVGEVWEGMGGVWEVVGGVWEGVGGVWEGIGGIWEGVGGVWEGVDES